MDPQRQDARVFSLLAAMAALAAGFALATSEVLRPLFPALDDVACDTGASYAVNAADLIAYAAMGFAILMLARRAGGGLSPRGRKVATIAAAASALTGVANAVEHCAHLESVGLVYVAGLLASMITTALFGIALIRTREQSRWIGWVITIGTVAFLLGSEPGWGRPVEAMAWTTVGVALVATRGPRPEWTAATG